jgi:hypothetical protein
MAAMAVIWIGLAAVLPWLLFALRPYDHGHSKGETVSFAKEN